MHPKIKIANSLKLMTASATIALAAGAARADFDRPGFNFYGVTGAIDTPTALDQPDGEIAVTIGHFGNITRGTLSFQGLPRVQGAFRYSKYSGLNLLGEPEYEDYFDRSFDISVTLLRERQYLPALKVGLQDLAGTGVSSGEYVVATKTFGDRLAVSAGLGWGRLGSEDPIGETGTRDDIDAGLGGEFNIDQWFRGDVAPFGSVIFKATDRLTLLAEYGSDAYTIETGNDRPLSSRIMDRSSSFNFGASYRVNEAVDIGAYYLYGSEFGVKLTFAGNPTRPPVVGSVGPAPAPVAPRPSRASSPDQWSEDWASVPRVQSALLTALTSEARETGLTVEAFEILGPNAVEVRFRNPTYNASAQAVGRMARALTRTMPSSVETFRIVPSVDGIPASAVTVRRSDVEALVLSPDASARLLAVAGIGDARGPNPDATLSSDLFPRFDWSVGPFVRRVFFDPQSPLRFGVGLGARASYEPRPGIVFSGSVSQVLLGNLDDTDQRASSALQPVRTNFARYNEEADLALDRLTAAYYFKPAREVYGRVTAGYLERMFGGISTEILWKPVESRLGLGAELNYVAQRDFDQRFGFQDYDVATGHVSAYYELTDELDVQLDVGRYLAGDVGATLSVTREFRNGWRVGVFATQTDVSSEDFGEGSFDKGITLEVPVAWFTGRPSTSKVSTTIRPITRDGGARLNVDGRLYEKVRDYHEDGLEDQWGRVWR
ncbi:YjbH domain-containing protein [Palleronia sp. LCG004]|uniref:YjbH domain-containing protein n=1 Tax=Palleronia sp. LCG004 TaxID=3079304 RepID=UPI002943743E|nr:YjbH domain-containing protein [Palleronia sp. LCG004]WOI57371.1 YjbH domain-containing protein [Palleronia sp. LCG004]